MRINKASENRELGLDREGGGEGLIRIADKFARSRGSAEARIYPKAARGHPGRATPNFAKLANAQRETTNDALFRLDHLAAHLDRLGRAAADLNQNRRQAHIALHIMLDAIAVFARSELTKRPFPRIQAIALLLHLDLIGARLVGDLEQLLEQQIRLMHRSKNTAIRSPRRHRPLGRAAHRGRVPLPSSS